MKYTLIILAILSLVILSACTTERVIVTNDPSAKDLNKINVLGNAQLEFSPDEAEIRFSVVTEANDLKNAQSKNAEIANRVIDNLKINGLSSKQIETMNFNAEKIREWEKERYVDKGYRVRNTIKVTTKDIENVGKLIDVAVNAGANDVEGLLFQLSKEAKQKATEQLLAKASEDARTKAELLTNALGVRLGKAVTISESNYQVSPRYYDTYAMKASMMESAPTPIQPKNVDTSASINVVFEIN